MSRAACGEVGAARIGDRGNANPPLISRQSGPTFEPLDAGDAEQFRVGHDVGLRDRDEILGAEIVADLDLMLDRPLPQRAELAGAHRLFFGGQPHGGYSCHYASAALINGTHLSISALTSAPSACGERWSGGGMSAPISASRLA